MIKSFSKTLTGLPGTFSFEQSCYSVENMLAPASVASNSTGDVFQEFQKHATMKTVAYRPIVYYKGTPKEITSCIFLSFKAP